jgi:hypothetical protein
MKNRGALMLLGILLTVMPLAAHHSTSAYFDVGRTVTLNGVITKVSLINPHAIILIKVTNANGPAETWALHGLALHALTRFGNNEKFKEGLSVSVKGYPARADVQPSKVASTVSADAVKGIVEAGEIRLASGEVLPFGRGPGFTGLPAGK